MRPIEVAIDEGAYREFRVRCNDSETATKVLDLFSRHHGAENGDQLVFSEIIAHTMVQGVIGPDDSALNQKLCHKLRVLERKGCVQSFEFTSVLSHSSKERLRHPDGQFVRVHKAA